MSSLEEQGDLFWTLTHQDTQSGILTRFFFFEKILLQSDRLQLITIFCNRRVCEQNTFTRHTFSHLHALISMSHVTVAQGVLRARHPCIIRMLLLS